MMKLSGKIRLKLLGEVNLKIYLVYALGEILLVVFGILIALQINQWQQNKQLRTTEIRMLQELEINLNTNLDVLTGVIEWESEMIKNIEYIFNHFQSNKPINDTLIEYMGKIAWVEELQLVNSTYETIKSIGLDIISSDSLRVDISQLFEVDYQKEESWVNSIANAQLTTITYPIIIPLFTRKEEQIVPIHYQKLKTDIAYNGMLWDELGFKKAILVRTKILIEKTENLREKVLYEIKRLH